MKFKAQDKQNQLIENITVHHLVIGVDIAQEVHVARARSAFVGLLWELRSNSVIIVKGHHNEYGYDKPGNTSGTSLQCRGKETEKMKLIGKVARMLVALAKSSTGLRTD